MFLCASLLGGSLVVLAVSHPVDGPAFVIRGALEERLDSRELRYAVHQALGTLFSLCPCTDGLSREQYRRAWFHRPLSAADMSLS
jgi:hypothetical protein